MAKRKRRAFTDEYKAEVVELIRRSGKSIGAVAKELDLTETAVRAWVHGRPFLPEPPQRPLVLTACGGVGPPGTPLTAAV